jgi:Ring finger domain
MADACIVCLGDLATRDPTTTSDSNPAVPANGKAALILNEDDLIAHLLPCGHNLHDSCLKPWVERANSCPICRAKFNEVQISEYIKGV